jgi:5-oxoprolinase (ATP-hydrolysing)
MILEWTLSPPSGAAVVAGNTETSQAVVNALFGAVGVVACSQATMNNFIFGDATRQYYETRSAAAPAPGRGLTAPRQSTPT